MIELVHVFELMGGASRDQLADEVKRVTGDPVYEMDWHRFLFDETGMGMVI